MSTSAGCMYNEIKSEYEEEMLKEAVSIWEEVTQDESLQDVEPPSDMREKIFSVIRENEAERVRAYMSEEDKELLRLGRIYKRRRKNRKYLVLVAAVVMILAVGITSVGGPEKIFEKITWMMGGREQTNMNSDEIVPVGSVMEEDVYQQIEDEYGFLPVRMMYLPEGVEFQEVAMGDEIQGIQIIYGNVGKSNIVYFVRPNYRHSSWGKDIEDKLLGEYQIDLCETVVELKKYQVEDKQIRWIAQFEYSDTYYSILMMDIEENEIEKILENLYFS